MEFYRADHLLEGHLERLIAAKDTPADLKAKAEATLPLVDGMSGDKDTLWAVMQVCVWDSAGAANLIAGRTVGQPSFVLDHIISACDTVRRGVHTHTRTEFIHKNGIHLYSYIHSLPLAPLFLARIYICASARAACVCLCI